MRTQAVYVHWPFCVSKCPYCDFNSHVAEQVDHGRWKAALRRELAHYAAETPGRAVTSVFFGGGTPSLMAPDTVKAVIQDVFEHWPATDKGIEITLEANPSSVEAARFADFRAAGVNRVSIGVQSLRDEALRLLGRAHGAGEARAAVKSAAQAFERVSFDLIYARPGQTLADWRGELGEALAMAGEHLSLYQLTIEPGTAFHKDGVAEMDGDLAADFYELTGDLTAAAGLPAYEVSNHARPGAACAHNLTYWTGGDYLGVGPGAHGRLSKGGVTEVTHQIRDPARWLAAVEEKGQATAGRRVIAPRARLEELLMMGLRLSDGISRARFQALTGLDFEQALAAAALENLQDGRYINLDSTGLRATPQGLLRLNAVLRELLASEKG